MFQLEQNKLKFWEEKKGVVLSYLKTSINGLSELEALNRLKIYGPNSININESKHPLFIFLSQFFNPLVLILVVASLVSGFLGDGVATTIILLIVFFSAIISFWQEYRSEKIIELLKKKVALKAEVIRDGKNKIIPAADLVVGDIVVLSLGKVVPADLRLIETDGLAINEALLTGESFPVEKKSQEQIVKDYLPQAMDNLAFAGTFVVQGSGRGVVIYAGKNTEFGKTAKLLTTKTCQTQFQKGINDFGIFLSKIIILFSLAIFLFLALMRGNWLESLLFALSIAVGISPELLPIIITINLSRAARIMSKNKVIIKKLPSVENLGNIDVLCTDKTGTLTEGKIVLKDYLNLSGNHDEFILKLSAWCNSLNLKRNRFSNPLDQAIFDYLKNNKKTKLLSGTRILASAPFDFQRRRMSVVVKNSETFMIAKGASEEILDICEKVEINNRQEDIKRHLKKIKEKITEQEKQGFKVILVAIKKNSEITNYSAKDEKDMVLVGLLVFFDPPKKTATKSIEMFRDMGVSIKLITGDSAESAKFLAQQLNFINQEICLGSQIDKMNQAELKNAVNNYDIFAKTTPEHKLKIVEALKLLGHNVGFMGDGVNDSPALHLADVGISVDSATDISKESADVILLKKDLRVLIDGIKEGRRTFGNTLKYIFCTISSNYGNMFSVVGAAILLPFIPMLPVQILLLNFLSDFPMLALSADTVDVEYLKKPKTWDIKKIRLFMNYFGLLSSCFDFITFFFLIFVVKASMSLFQSGWFWQSFLTEVILIFIVRTRQWFWQSRPARILFLSSIITTILVLIIIYTPLSKFFGFQALPINVFMGLTLISLIYFVLSELVKKMFYRYYEI